VWQIESQIRDIQAQIAGNSGTIAKICNADVADLGFKMRVHELIEVPLIQRAFMPLHLTGTQYLEVCYALHLSRP